LERPEYCPLASCRECHWLFELLSRSLALILDGTTLEQPAGRFWPRTREQLSGNGPVASIKC